MSKDGKIKVDRSDCCNSGVTIKCRFTGVGRIPDDQLEYYACLECGEECGTHEEEWSVDGIKGEDDFKLTQQEWEDEEIKNNT